MTYRTYDLAYGSSFALGGATDLSRFGFLGFSRILSGLFLLGLRFFIHHHFWPGFYLNFSRYNNMTIPKSLKA